MSEPLVTTLSYSAGKQSHALLEMVLRGDIERPKDFIVLNADPGMENENTYRFVREARNRCWSHNIPFYSESTALAYDLLSFKARGLTRLDQPPYWTRNRITGKKGRLKQKCTPFYKVAALRRLLRTYLENKYGISRDSKRVPKCATWIGFAADEQDRANKLKQIPKFIALQCPLIEMGMTKAKVVGYYLKHKIEQPPVSVCNACFSNGLSTYEEMYFNRPDDFEQACQVDDAIRDMSQLGIKDECFVSSTLTPLRQLPALNFKKDDVEYYREHRCNSGACFV